MQKVSSKPEFRNPKQNSKFPARHASKALRAWQIPNSKLIKGFYSRRRVIYLCLIYFSFSLVVLSKEELGFIVFMFGFFLYFKFKNLRKHIIIISILGLFWSLICFLYIIPKYGETRVEGVNNFISYVGGVDGDSYKELTGDNYFLYRYSEFGKSYAEILKNLIFKPTKTVSFIFSTENITTLNQLFLPVLYLTLFSPLIFLAIIPEIAIHILSGEPEVFSITNHRLLIIIPLTLLALIEIFKSLKVYYKYIPTVLISVLLVLNIYLGIKYKNPLTYPIYEKFYSKIFASSTEEQNIEFFNDIRTECADQIITRLKPYNKVSVPQPFGAQTSNKNYNALFPAGLSEANAVVTDIYARKLIDFLEISTDYNKKAVSKLLSTENLKLEYSCDRFFMLTKSPTNINLGYVKILEDYVPTDSPSKLLTESFYHNLQMQPAENNTYNFVYTYQIGDEENRKSLFTYTLLVPKNRGEILTFAHFPSTYINPINDWPINSIVEESVFFTLPVSGEILNGAEYNVYFGIGNRGDNSDNILVGTFIIE